MVVIVVVEVVVVVVVTVLTVVAAIVRMYIFIYLTQHLKIKIDSDISFEELTKSHEGMEL